MCLFGIGPDPCLDVSMVRVGVCGGGVGDCRTGVCSMVIVAMLRNDSGRLSVLQLAPSRPWEKAFRPVMDAVLNSSYHAALLDQTGMQEHVELKSRQGGRGYGSLTLHV